jgi:hypothetical protein
MVGILALFVLAGCGAHAPVKTPAAGSRITESDGQAINWWYVRFRLVWPDEEEPDWSLDALIAHQIVAPVLEQYDDQIQLWRFHRRASRDSSGHQFSFIFYGSVETAAGIYAELQGDDLLNEMISANVIKKVLYDDLASTTRPGIADTSDPSWPPAVQDTWPYYIMGASRMWLGLIGETAESNTIETSPASIDEMQIFYSSVNESITEVWQKKGLHAFLHHLNALFGYEPLLFYEGGPLRF